MLTFEPYDFAHSFNLLVQRTYSLRSNELAYSQLVLFRVANFVFGSGSGFAKNFGRVSGSEPEPKPARTEKRPLFVWFRQFPCSFLYFYTLRAAINEW